MSRPVAAMSMIGMRSMVFSPFPAPNRIGPVSVSLDLCIEKAACLVSGKRLKSFLSRMGHARNQKLRFV